MGGNRESAIVDAYRHVIVRPQVNEGGPVRPTTVGSFSSTIEAGADGWWQNLQNVPNERMTRKSIVSGVAVTITNMTFVKLNYG